MDILFNRTAGSTIDSAMCFLDKLCSASTLEELEVTREEYLRSGLRKELPALFTVLANERQDDLG